MKAALALATFLMTTALYACPYCMGTGQGGKDNNTTLILSLFILSIYIPYVLIFRMIKKHQALKDANNSTGPAGS